MRFEEIKNGGVYKTELKVQFRTPEEIHEVSLLIRVVGIREKVIEIVFLNDPTYIVHYLIPSQIDTVS